MPHAKARKETNCLNCNAEVSGRYCSICGQENIEPKETFWQLLSHFVYDLFHYDGKALSTLKTLIFQPGLLTREFVRGRRASYLHPIRLYIFIAATFFVIFISFIVNEKANDADLKQLTTAQQSAINKSVYRLKDSLAKTNDPAKKAQLLQTIKALEKVPDYFKIDSSKSSKDSTGITDSSKTHEAIYDDNLPATIDEYNKQQAKLLPDKRDGWIKQHASIKLIELNEKLRDDKEGFLKELGDHFFHSLPTMMFISLPVVALIFQLLYIRRRKQFTYVQHGVFSVHIYIAMYIFILLVYGFNLLENATHWRLFGYLSSISIIGIFYYLYRAMRNFYEQGRWKTFFKFFILLCAYSVILIMLMAVFLMTSLIQI